MRVLHSVQRVLNITGLTATSHTDLSTESVDDMRIHVNVLLATTVYPTCTRDEVETLWEHHGSLTVRTNFRCKLLSVSTFGWTLGHFLQQIFFQASFLLLNNLVLVSFFTFKALIQVHSDILLHLTR